MFYGQSSCSALAEIPLSLRDIASFMVLLGSVHYNLSNCVPLYLKAGFYLSPIAAVKYYPKLSNLKQHKFLSSRLVGHKSKMAWQNWIPSWASRSASTPLLFKLLEAFHSPFFLAASLWTLLLSSSLLHWLGHSCLPLQSVSSVQSLSSVWLFATPWTAAHQASLSITNSRSLLKLMSIESVMPSNHLMLCCPLLLLP